MASAESFNSTVQGTAHGSWLRLRRRQRTEHGDRPSNRNRSIDRSQQEECALCCLSLAAGAPSGTVPACGMNSAMITSSPSLAPTFATVSDTVVFSPTRSSATSATSADGCASLRLKFV